MGEKFVVTPKKSVKNDDKSIVVSVRMNRELRDEYEKLSSKTGRSRNELICMALKYALDNVSFESEHESIIVGN